MCYISEPVLAEENAALKEKLQEYALIAEIIGGIAIVCSLIFVGVQIRQNSEVSEINAYQELTSQITLINTLRVQNADFANLYWRFEHGIGHFLPLTLLPEEGVEPSPCCQDGILNPA